MIKAKTLLMFSRSFCTQSEFPNVEFEKLTLSE